ncbi:MAG: GNAT family N-acyltransferase [Candidatus Spechtbacterales bacterium]|nr:GNAT family N-acyltransferase [Candidatus Spechtbacterales bacterium]
MKEIKKNLLLWLKKIYLRIYLKWLFKFSGIEVKIAENEEDLQDVFKLRYRIYKESGYINPEDYPDEIFKDPYDKYSINFLALYKNKPAGIVRLVKNSELGYTLEQYYNLELPAKGRSAVEVSRLAVDREYRGGKRRIVIALMRSAFRWSKENDVKYWYMFMPEKLAKAFEDLGGKFNLLEERELTEENKTARKSLAGYFEKTGAKPYVLSVKELNDNLDRMKIYW